MNAKRKGSGGERELLRILSEHGEAVRNDQRYTGGAGNPDIRFTLGGEVLHCEVKRCERLSLPAAIRQAEGDAAAGTIPVVIHRRNREPWRITLRLEDFFRLAKGARND